MLRARSISLLLAVSIAAACGDGGSARRALIVQALVEQDRALAYLRPELVAQKYVEMASAPQPFLRGTAAIFYRDLTRLDGASDGRNTLPHTSATELVQLYGDLHLENLGVSFDPSGMFVDCVDFDATVAGPAMWDVRRAALGVALASPTAVASLAAGYAEGLDAADEPIRANAGALLDDLLATSDERRATRDELAQYTELRDGQRRMLRNSRLIEVPAPFAARLQDGITAYRANRRQGRGDDATFVVKDAVMRLGTGISSLANLRFWVLLEGAPGEADDLILELKEQRDPPFPLALLGRGPTSAHTFDNAARVVAGTDRLLASSLAEDDLGHTTIEGVAFQVRTVSRGRDSLDFADVDSASDTDVDALADRLGRVLANGHRRSVSADALRALFGSVDSVVNYLDEASSADVAQLTIDRDHLNAALAELGPLLGGGR